MQVKLDAAEGTLVGYKTTSSPDLDLALRVKLGDQKKNKKLWAVFESLCPGLDFMAQAVAGKEEVGAQHIHCHTPIENLTVRFATCESEDPSVDPVTQLELEDCKVIGTKSCILMVDKDGDVVVSFHVAKRIPKADLKKLADLKGADLIISTEPTQPNLPGVGEKAAA